MEICVIKYNNIIVIYFVWCFKSLHLISNTHIYLKKEVSGMYLSIIYILLVIQFSIVCLQMYTYFLQFIFYVTLFKKNSTVISEKCGDQDWVAKLSFLCSIHFWGSYTTTFISNKNINKPNLNKLEYLSLPLI